MNHCKTCKYFVDGLYPNNAQLGHCKRVEIRNTQPAGHAISRRECMDSMSQNMFKYLTPRVLDDFGCVWHKDKEITTETKVKIPHYENPMDFYGDSVQARLQELNAVNRCGEGFQPTTLSEFAAGYGAALRAVRAHGLDRVEKNAHSGIPK